MNAHTYVYVLCKIMNKVTLKYKLFHSSMHQIKCYTVKLIVCVGKK